MFDHSLLTIHHSQDISDMLAAREVAMILPVLSILLQPTTPLDFGRRELALVAPDRVKDISIEIAPAREKECYAITQTGTKIKVVASDQNGAMYGAFELAERLRNKQNVKAEGTPFLKDRGLNLFLTLPWDYKKNNTDYDSAALTDSERWWFQNDDYWVTLLDLMAKSRLNWLDIHGAWDISVTNAPNLYAYFVTSKSFPLVGVSEQIKAQNLARLNKVIEMAHARGIRVSLMAYEANLKIPQNPNPPYEATEQNIYKYTAEVVEQMIRKAPGLDAIGYRIGESGKGESFFHCYGEAVKNSGREIPIITRSWITRKQKVLPLARASKDFTVEIKYNGEQWGAPYMVAGGRVANWYSYSFEDYLSDSGQKGVATWRGNMAEGGGRWPDQPYKIVWQVRANGTHRIFPFYNPDWVRRSIQCMKIGTASGYTIEGLDAYYPKSPEYYLADPEGNPYTWIHQRDEMYWTTWGRLGYDPTTPDQTFDQIAKRHFTRAVVSGGQQGLGDQLTQVADDARRMVDAWKSLSVLMPKAFMGFSLGPDHRSHAPELEWGGPTDAYVQGQGFDSHTYLPINEELANRWTGGIDGRVPMWDLSESLATGTYLKDNPAAEGPIGQFLPLMESRSNYMRARIQSAYWFAQSEAQGDQTYQRALSQLTLAGRYHDDLVRTRLIRPFTERLRMHTNTFHWRDDRLKFDEEFARVTKLATGKSVELPIPSQKREFPGYLSWKQEKGKIVCNLIVSDDAQAWLLYKPLPSSTYFHRIPMNHVKLGEFEAELPVANHGYIIAAEAYHPNYEAARRFPQSTPEQPTPYLVVPAKAGPTPQFYSGEEAMTFLDPKVITQEKYSTMLLGTRSWNFFGWFNTSTQRKILDPVERGMRLVILQQDFNRYKLDFLPKPIKIEAANLTTFNPGGQLGLEKVETDAIMWQKFAPSEGWEIFGNGGLARLKIGKGEVWVTTARLMQRMHIPGVARNFVKLLSLGGKVKPTVLVDSCSEGADFSSSCHPDLMNSHDIPFLTLGEVIAKEQGMNSFKAIPGPTKDDDILEGKGTQQANAWLKSFVVEASKRPTAKTKAEFEDRRYDRKLELRRALGLEPMLPKTPLNSRITGVIKRKGYRIEKVVFESRPKFYVTAHVYLPDSEEQAVEVYPVIVNVNGHWAHKKNEDRIQLRCAFQALQGYMAIAIDSPGWSFEGNSLIERRAEGNHNDWALFQGGTNATGYYVWDTIRALDYVASRPDADMKRIGITGASGGGLATLYAFAADDRYTCAAPVVYMSSLELAPDNGCLCNHVPGTCQIGDRSDVMAIQAPKPVFILGAQNDGEFPPAAMRLTGEKLRRDWALFERASNVRVQIFDGPHDYSQPMREAVMGFFNQHLKGHAEGAPVPQPTIEAIEPEDRQLLVLDPPAKDERTMRDLSLEYLAKARKEVTDWGAGVNGGLLGANPKATELGTGPRRPVIYDCPVGLRLPGILFVPKGTPKGYRIVVSDAGKAAELAANPPDPGFKTLYLDTLGVGELAGIEMRYPIYLGKSLPFMSGWHIARIAASAFQAKAEEVEVIGRGPISSQSVMWAGMMVRFKSVSGFGSLREWADVFKDGMPPVAIQPRAHLLGSLENLRKRVPNGRWEF